MRFNFNALIGILVLIALTSIPAWMIFNLFFDRVETYYPIQATVQSVEYHESYNTTSFLMTGKVLMPISQYHPEEWEYSFKSDTIGSNIYFFRLTSDQNLGSVGTITVHYGYRRISKQIQFSW